MNVQSVEHWMHHFDAAQLTADVLRDVAANQAWTLSDLRDIHDWLRAQSVTIKDSSGKPLEIPSAALLNPPGTSGEAAALLVMTHGNEPAGLAAVGLALMLAAGGHLRRPLYLILSTPLAAGQYFAALQAEPGKHTESRDLFRRGFAADGSLLRDPNRIPANFREQRHIVHNQRAWEIEELARHFADIFDIHSARGNLRCVTDHVVDAHLLYSPIRSILTSLMGSIAQHDQAVTYKGVLLALPNIRSCTGIEAGAHEDPESFTIAAHAALAWLYNIGASAVEPPMKPTEDGQFIRYHVGPAMPFSALEAQGGSAAEDMFYAVQEISDASAMAQDAEVLVAQDDGLRVMTAGQAAHRNDIRYAVRVYEELECVRAGQVVAAAVPSGQLLRAKEEFYALFVAKPRALYADPATGIMPVARADLHQKFCYPCKRETIQIA